MNDIDIRNFEFEGSKVRSYVEADEPWFVLVDICRVLEILQPHRAAARLDDDEKGSHTVTTLGGPQEVTVINESGLYSLILTSRKAAAKRFKKWVTSEVLPTLRRTGVYIMGGQDEDLPSLADGKVFGMKVAKVNAAARLISVANAIYGPEAARALWESEMSLPKLAHKTVAALSGSEDDDPDGCFRQLLRFAVGNGKRVGDILRLGIHDAISAKMLSQYGMMMDPHPHKGNLAVASAHPFLSEAYGQTQWASGWQITLMQLDGAKSARLRFSAGGAVIPFVLIPKRTVLTLLSAYH